MSKLGKFAAACVAVLCAFGLQAATTYTWSGAGDGTSWCEAANWTVGTAVAENYPGEIAVDDAATFPANAEATVVLSGDLTVNALNLNGGDIVVTFKGLDSAAALRVNVFNPGKASAPTTLTFDALELCLGNAVTVYGDTTLKLVNGARFTNSATGGRNFVFTNPNCRLEMSGGSSFVSDQHTFCLGENNVIVLDDSQLRVANLYFNYVQKVNASTVTLKGAHPVFEVQTYFQSNNNGNCKGTTEFVFEVPEGGYAEPPLQGRNVKFFDAGNAPNGNAVLTVSADSPALSAGTLTETALAWDWSGVNSAKLVLTETSGATFAWTQADGATASTADANRIFLKAAVGSGEPAPSAVTVSHLSTRPNIVRTARTLTGYGYVIALADGLTTRLTLLVGKEKDKGACTEVVSGVATATGCCALPAWDAPEFEKDYWYFVRCETLDDKGVVLGTSETDLATVRTQDNSTYTWCGGADGNWDDPANWSSSRGADCLGYPQSTASYVQFPVSCIARIHVRRSVAGCLQFNAADQSVVIDDLGSEGPVTVAAGWDYNANAYVRSHLTLEGANLSVTTSGGLYVPTTSVLTVKDGAVFTFGQTNALNSKGRVEVLNGGKIVCNSHIYMGPPTQETAPAIAMQPSWRRKTNI